MTDLRARLAAVLREHGNSGKPTWANECLCICGETFRTMPPGQDFADHLVGVLLSPPGIAIVHTDDIKYAFSDPHLGYDRHRAAINRLLKAAEQDPR